MYFTGYITQNVLRETLQKAIIIKSKIEDNDKNKPTFGLIS